MDTEERKTLWRQYAQAHAKAQETYDASIRTLAAAGLAVTVTLATALESLDGYGTTATTALVIALGANLVSYATAQMDLRRRLKFVKVSDARGREPTFWTTLTFLLNLVAGLGLLAGGLFLAWFVSSSL